MGHFLCARHFSPNTNLSWGKIITQLQKQELKQVCDLSKVMQNGNGGLCILTEVVEPQSLTPNALIRLQERMDRVYHSSPSTYCLYLGHSCLSLPSQYLHILSCPLIFSGGQEWCCHPIQNASSTPVKEHCVITLTKNLKGSPHVFTGSRW